MLCIAIGGKGRCSVYVPKNPFIDRLSPKVSLINVFLCEGTKNRALQNGINVSEKHRQN